MKDEKTRLYQTNDSLLSNDEILRKYQYVANDKDMDYATMKPYSRLRLLLASNSRSEPHGGRQKKAWNWRESWCRAAPI